MSKSSKDLTKILSATALAGCAISVGVSAQAADNFANPTLGDESLYTMTEVGRGDNFNADSIETPYITKYEYDSESGEIVPVYYSFGENTKLQIDDLVQGSSTHEVIESAMTVETSYFNNSSTEEGGAILVNSTDAVNINGHFVGNYSDSDGGAIYKDWGASIGTIKGDFLGNESYSSGGAIHTYHYGDVEKIVGDFIDNSAQEGGAIYNRADVGSLTGNFVGNRAYYSGGAIANFGSMNIKNSGFYNNISGDSGGAIIHEGSLQIENSIFAENKVLATDSYASGGALIYVNLPKAAVANVEPANDETPRYDNITNSVFIRNSVEQMAVPTSLDDGGIQTYVANPSEYRGGAIANQNTIGKIDADFIENGVYAPNYSNGYGGAIYNSGRIVDTITGLFKDNKVEVSQAAYGGAIVNDYDIGTVEEADGSMVQNVDVIKGTFTSESGETLIFYGVAPEGQDVVPYTMLEEALAEGMKIGTINTIEFNNTCSDEEFAEFKANLEQSVSTGVLMTQNPVDLISSDAYYSGPEFVGGIEGDFVGNKAISYDEEAYGGAIFNSDWSMISNIKGNFENNSAEGYYSTSGGAIANGGIIGVIGGDAEEGKFAASFVENTATSYQESADGGAISNAYSINNIKNVAFVGNQAQAPSYAMGGAISNRGMIGAEEPYSEPESISTYDQSAPYPDDYMMLNNKGIMDSAFVDNAATSYRYSSGGALYNNFGVISTIGNTLFEGNKAEVLIDNRPESITPRTQSPYAMGGAIYNDGSIINKIANSTFKNNAAINDLDYGFARGGAIFNDYDSTIGSIENTVFDGNKVEADESAYGGAILNEGEIGNISGEFKNNSVMAYGYWAEGGAIGAVDGSIGDINANFSNNYAQANNGLAMGGAIAVETSYYGNMIGNFAGNYAKGSDAYGGAIFLTSDSRVKPTTISGTFSGNYALATGDSWSRAYGGAIYNGWSQMAGSLALANTPTTYQEVRYVPTIVNSSFINNYAKAEGENSYARGGAIYTIKDLDIIANNGYKSVISGNYVEDSYGKRNEAIYVGDWSNLQFIANTDGSIQIDDAVVLDGGDVHFTGDETGKITLNNNIYAIAPQPTSLDEEFDSDIYGGTTWVYLSNANLHLGLRDNVLDNHFLTLNSGSFSMINDEVGVSNPYNLTINGDTKFYGDVDLENEVMDRFEVQDSYGNFDVSDETVRNGYHSGNLVVSGLNMISDMKDGQDVAAIYFAETGLMNNVEANFGEMPHPEQTTFYTPIYKYNAVYDNTNDYGQGEGGYFVFTRGDKIPVIVPGGGAGTTPGKPSDAFNPAVLGSSVSSAAGAMSTMTTTFNYAFQNADNFMNIPYLERIAIRDRNKYALSPTGDATDVGTFSPLFTRQETASAWVKPYATFESVNLDNGPKVSNITYGTLVGFDTELESIKGGWDRVFTGYIGYNGASQRYSGVDSYQNGGLLGGTMTLYKGNFFNATTLSTGASVANNTNMYGNEDYAMLLAGIGNKMGYNFEFKEGKVILQPSMLVSYTFVNTFDYTNAAGVRINNDPLHALQLAPGLKLIGNTKGGWQPYLGVSMVWNMMDNSSATANGVKLPSMSMKPYVQYGVGVQKRMKDNFMAFGQAMIQNGGRNGISLTAGFRWAIGKDKDDSQKVFKPFLKKEAKKIGSEAAKQLSRHPEVKTEGSRTSNEILRSAQNDGSRKILKQMIPEQRMVYGARHNTSRTASSGMLKQL